MHRKRAQRIWVELSSWLGRRWLTFASSPKPGQWPCGGVRTWWGANGKVSIERLCLSPYVGKPLNSKVIKSFVPELRNRVFRVSRFLCSMYMLWTFYVHFTYPYLAMVYIVKPVCFCPPLYLFIYLLFLTSKNPLKEYFYNFLFCLYY